MPLRILHVIGQIGLGGCELQLLELCRRHDPAKWHIGVCYYSHDPEDLVEEFTETGIDLFYIDKCGMSLPSFLLGMAGVIRQFRPDVIHTWQRSPNLWGRVVGLACGCSHLVASDRTMRPQYDSMFWPAVEMLLAPFTIRLGNSWAVARRVQQLLSLPRQRIGVIHNAVELPVRDRHADRASVREELNLPQGQKLVLTVGRLYQAKDYPTLFQAAAEVVPHRPDVTFLCAGHGPEQDSLAQLHRKMNLGDRLRLLGLRRDVPRLMSAADVFCLASQWEGFPNDQIHFGKASIGSSESGQFAMSTIRV
jgi:glycosyltransferase involved in cell wall biosynthesis